MSDRFPPPGWHLQPENWPHWLPNPLMGAYMPSSASRNAWAERPAHPVDDISISRGAEINDPAAWGRSPASAPPTAFSSAPLHSGRDQARPPSWPPLSEANFWPPAPFPQTAMETPTDPRSEYGAVASNTPTPRTQPDVPFYGPGDVLMPPPEPAPPAPPKDFRTWLRDALSDENIRHYIGPHAFEALRKLHALTQVLPGSGTVQSAQDTSRAKEEAEAGNYGKAAGHLGIGTANAALDWLPPAKLAIIGGTMAKTFPWERLPIAMKMEAAGRSADEIWPATGLGRAADDRWIFEISDKGYQVRPYVGERAALYKHHAHPGMREAYPNVANWPSIMSVHPYQKRSGRFRRDEDIAVLAPDVATAREIGIHELQHLIDFVEKHPPGGSWKQFMGPGVSAREAWDLKRRLIGEVVARNAQHRLKMSERGRRLRSPQSTESIPRDQQINWLYDDSGNVALPPSLGGTATP